MLEMDSAPFIWGAVLSPVATWLVKKVLEQVKSRGTPDESKQGLKVVITGSSRGLGLALANEFLRIGDSVIISSRTKSTIETAVAELSQKHPHGEISGESCNVSNLEQVENLANVAAERLGKIDIWINNAALSNTSPKDLTEIDPQKIEDIVSTNLLGSLWGCRAAMAQMKKQPTGGKIFLMDGTGAWGNPTPKNVAYGATKRALTQLKDSLVAQTKGSKISVHIASPGMVATSLLLEAGDTPRSAKFINILAESSENVAKWLVPRFRGAKGNGQYFKFLTPAGVLWRLLTSRSRSDRFIDTKTMKRKIA